MPIWDVSAPDFAVGMKPGVYTGWIKHFSIAEGRVRAGFGEEGGGAGCGAMKITLKIEGSARVVVLSGPRPRTVGEGELDADSGVGGRWRAERISEGRAWSFSCPGGAWSWRHEGSMGRVARLPLTLYLSISYDDPRFPSGVVRNDQTQKIRQQQQVS